MEPKFTSAELKVMEEFWKHGRLSIREVQESFPEKGRPPYTSIQTIVYRLEEQGALRRVRKIGNAHIFEATVSRNAVQRRKVGQCGCRQYSGMQRYCATSSQAIRQRIFEHRARLSCVEADQPVA